MLRSLTFLLSFSTTWKPLLKIPGIPSDALKVYDIYFVGVVAGRICIELLCRKRNCSKFSTTCQRNHHSDAISTVLVKRSFMITVT